MSHRAPTLCSALLLYPYSDCPRCSRLKTVLLHLCALRTRSAKSNCSAFKLICLTEATHSFAAFQGNLFSCKRIDRVNEF